MQRTNGSVQFKIYAIILLFTHNFKESSFIWWLFIYWEIYTTYWKVNKTFFTCLFKFDDNARQKLICYSIDKSLAIKTVLNLNSIKHSGKILISQEKIFFKMSQLKLNYFDAKGRAELSRLILAQSGTAYDDHRINFSDWPNLKAGRARMLCVRLDFTSLNICSFQIPHWGSCHIWRWTMLSYLKVWRLQDIWRS